MTRSVKLMRAAWYSQGGAAGDVLQIGSISVPEPEEGEVRVRLNTSGVNPRDIRSRRAAKVLAAPVVPHSDGAGTIDRIGANVGLGRLGQRVWVFNAQWQRRLGTAAEYVVLPQSLAVNLPDDVSFEEGACLGTPALTAAEALRRLGDVAGKTILITGGGSSVGSFAVQIATAKGARVIATASARRRMLAIASGANLVLDRDAPDLAEGIKQASEGKGVDHVVDLDLAALLPMLSRSIVAHGGIIVAYGSQVRGQIGLPFDALLAGSLSIQVFGIHMIDEFARVAALRLVREMLATGAFRIAVGAAFPLDEIAAAHEAVESGSIVGQTVLTI
jgi:NADPH2:quinone reductase